ncbi:MAG: hypothetical protein HFF05_02755 [Oscillospiraceae bacterium]|nr:hypothetical protein [Oscillospiraceae bacterium]
MKFDHKRPVALALTLTMLAGAMAPAAGALSLSTSYNETYYATLDYYGALSEASVVKSYRTNGNATVTDYGVYDEITNLTDHRQPQVSDGAVAFDLSGDVPERFYFEGKTSQPFEELPWTISVSYKHNGAAALAEELGGKSGLFEIDLDVLPNPGASEYSRNNLVLTAATAFNDDDLISLEAPGAQVQMVGNLRAILFAVLPGEEQHFAIRVGTDDFSFSGLIFLAVPATLQQLEQVNDLRQAKDKAEDSYHSIDDSLDSILDSLDGIGSSLRSAASGLDQLNNARSTVSAGKDEVYQKTNLALSDLHVLADTLGQLDKYSDTASQAITEANGILNDMNSAAQSLNPELANTRKIIHDIQVNTESLSKLLTDIEGYNKRSTDIASSLAEELDDLNGEMDGLELSLRSLRNALNRTKGISKIDKLTIGGMTSAQEIQEKITQVNGLYAQYQDALANNELPAGTSFQEGILLGSFKQAYTAQVEEMITAQVTQAYQQYCQEEAAAGRHPISPEEFKQLPNVQTMIQQAQEQAMAPEAFQAQYSQFLASDQGKEAAATAAAAEQLYNTVNNMSAEELAQQLKLMETVNTSVIPEVNAKIREINDLITDLTRPTASVVDELADLCETLGDTGISDDMASLAKLIRDLLKTMKEHEGEGASLLEHVDDLGNLASRITSTAETLLGQIDALTELLNTYEPDVLSALNDVQTLSGSAQSTLHDTSSALSAAEGLLRSSGPALSSGAGASLNGLSDVLRKVAVSMDQTDSLRSAKTSLSDLIEDEWNSHTGEDNNLLLMDAGADPISMTSTKNDAPESIQYVMRTQEIKAPDETDETTSAAQEKENSSFWSRIAAMFRDFWHAITGLFGKHD